MQLHTDVKESFSVKESRIMSTVTQGYETQKNGHIWEGSNSYRHRYVDV